MFKRRTKKMPRQMGVLYADVFMGRYLDEGFPVPWPTTKEAIPAFVEAIVPLAVQEIGSTIAAQADSMIAVPTWVVDEIGQGFRDKFTSNVLEIFHAMGS